jgi:hypothetical protein
LQTALRSRDRFLCKNRAAPCSKHHHEVLLFVLNKHKFRVDSLVGWLTPSSPRSGEDLLHRNELIGTRLLWKCLNQNEEIQYKNFVLTTRMVSGWSRWGLPVGCDGWCWAVGMGEYEAACIAAALWHALHVCCTPTQLLWNVVVSSLCVFILWPANRLSDCLACTAHRRHAMPSSPSGSTRSPHSYERESHRTA